MLCKACGANNPDMASYCGNCGGKLVIESSNPANDDVVEISVGAKHKPVSDLMKYGVLASTVFIPFIGMIMGLIFIAQAETEDKKDVGKLWLYTSIAIIVLYLMFSSEL